MPAGDYLEGLFFASLSLVAVLAATILVARRRLGGYAGAERWVAAGLVATAGLLGVHLLPAVLGVLSRETVLASSALLVLLATLLPAADRDPLPAPANGIPAAPAARFLVAASIALLAALVVALARDQLLIASPGIDSLNFHLPGVARWIETGSIWQIDVFLPDVAPGHYPNHGDVILLATVLPWSNDFLTHYAMYPFWLLSGVAVHALSRELGASREAGACAACLVLATPAVTVPALPGGLVDALLLFGFAAGLLFLVRHHRGGRGLDLGLAGLALGIALGTKWYGVTAVAIVFACWALARIWNGDGARPVIRDGAVLGTVIGLAGGVWLLRNLLESGNPFFPVKLAPLGLTIFDAPRDVVRELGGFTLLGYLDDPGVWTGLILPQFRDALAIAGLVAIAGIVLAAILVFRRSPAGRTAARRGLLVCGIVVAAGITLAYSITPYTAGGPEGQPVLVGANARYAIPALIIAAAATAWAASRFRRGTTALAALTLLAVLDGVRLAAGGELSHAKPGVGDWLFAIVAVLALAAAALCAVAVRRSGGLGLRSRRGAVVAVAAGVAIVAVAAVAVGNEVQERFNERRYLGADPATDPIVAASGPPRRIGLAGIWADDYSPAYPAFGKRLQNEVEYVGRPRNEVLRRFSSRRAFAEALRGGDYDFLIVGRGRPGAERVPELRWARRAGFRPLALSERLALLERAGGGRGESEKAPSS